MQLIIIQVKGQDHHPNAGLVLTGFRQCKAPPTLPTYQCIFETVAETLYIDGDILKREGVGNKIIVQVCNDAGAWCKASQKALSRVWSKPEECYKQWFKSKTDFKLGKVKLVAVEEDIWVALMIAQQSKYFGKSPIYQYGFVKNGILEVSLLARQMDASVHLLQSICGTNKNWDQIRSAVDH